MLHMQMPPLYSLPVKMTIPTSPFTTVVLAPGQKTYNTLVCPFTGEIEEILHFLWPQNSSVYWELFRGTSPSAGALLATGNAAPYVYPNGTAANYFYTYNLNIPCYAGDVFTLRITNTSSVNVSIPAIRRLIFTLTGTIPGGAPPNASGYYPDYSMAPFSMSAFAYWMGVPGVYWFGQPFFEQDSQGPVEMRSIIGQNNISWLFTCIDSGYIPLVLEGVVIPISTPNVSLGSVTVSINTAEWVVGHDGIPYEILKPTSTVIASGTPSTVMCYQSGSERRYFVTYSLPQPVLLHRFAVGFSTSVTGTTWFAGMRGISTWTTWSIFPNYGRGAWDRTSSGDWIYRNTVIRLVGLMGEYVMPSKRRVLYV